MGIIFSLPHLFDAVVARFALDGTNVPQFFGWLEPSRQMPGLTRIVWIPGDPSGAMGEVTAPKYTGMNPRQRATLHELCTVEITAFDAGAQAVERSQYQVAREIFDAWLRAVDVAAVGTYSIVKTEWVGGDRVLRAGATIRVVFSVQSPVFDLPIPVAPADTGALIDVHELEHTEQVEVRPPFDEGDT